MNGLTKKAIIRQLAIAISIGDSEEMLRQHLWDMNVPEDKWEDLLEAYRDYAHILALEKASFFYETLEVYNQYLNLVGIATTLTSTSISIFWKNELVAFCHNITGSLQVCDPRVYCWQMMQHKKAMLRKVA